MDLAVILKFLFALNINNFSESDFFSFIPVVIIIIVFVYFLVILCLNVKKLKNKISKLTRKSTDEDYNKAFGDLWTDYTNSFIQYSFGSKTPESASNYFNSTQLLQKSKGIPFLTSASNILVGLGVLGTFLGLTVGISGFDTTTSDAIKDSIQGLLSGMGSAFLTSLWGMFLSLIMTMIEKYQIGRLQITLHKLCYEIDAKYKLSKEDEISIREYEMIKLYDRYFIYQDEQGNKSTIANLLHSNYIAIDEMKGAMQSFSSDLAVKIDAGFESILQSESLQEILPALHSVKMEISNLGNDLKSPATDMVDRIVGELGSAISGMMAEMQKSVSDSTSKNLTHITELLVSSSQALVELPVSLKNMTSDLNNSFDQMKLKIHEASEQTYAQSKNSVNTAQEMMINTVEQMNKQFEMMTINLSDVFNNIGQKLDSIANTSTAKSQETFDEFHSLVQATTKASQDQLAINQAKQSELLKVQQETTQEIMINTAEQMNKQFETMTKNLSDVFNNIGQKLDSIANASTTKSQEAFDELHSLVQATTKASQDQVIMNQAKQSELFKEQQEAVQALQILLHQFQESVKNMTLVNSAVGTTIKQTVELQAGVSSSCTQLAGFSDIIKRSSDNFVLSQEQFRKYTESFISNNMNLVDELQKLVSESIHSTTKNVERYGTINEGIEGIFNKIHEGLVQYQRTIEDGVKNSLNSFTESLTSSSEALSGAANTHTDLLEELISVVDKIKR